MNDRTERSEAKLSRTVKLARHDGQIIGAPLFLSVSDLHAVGIDLKNADYLVFEVIESQRQPVINVSGRNESSSGICGEH